MCQPHSLLCLRAGATPCSFCCVCSMQGASTEQTKDQKAFWTFTYHTKHFVPTHRARCSVSITQGFSTCCFVHFLDFQRYRILTLIHIKSSRKLRRRNTSKRVTKPQVRVRAAIHPLMLVDFVHLGFGRFHQFCLHSFCKACYMHTIKAQGHSG